MAGIERMASSLPLDIGTALTPCICPMAAGTRSIPRPGIRRSGIPIYGDALPPWQCCINSAVLHRPLRELVFLAGSMVYWELKRMVSSYWPGRQ
jgi:hypothetical protein